MVMIWVILVVWILHLAEPVREGVDGELGGEDHREGQVQPVQQHPQRRRAPAGVRVCVCVCVCARARARVCVCV